MINRISVEDRNSNIAYRHSQLRQSDKASNPSFKGVLWPLLLQGIQECEKNPMVNVAVVDMFSAILPRTFVESLTNWFAGFEAFRRESSGLIVNCIIPSFITMGVAMGLNKFIMPKGVDMSKCWADSSLIQRSTEIYKKSNAEDKVKDTFKELILNTQGYHGNKTVIFGDELTSAEIEKYATKLKELSVSAKDIDKDIKIISEEISKKTHVFENIRVGGSGKSVKASTIKTLLEDSVKFFREFQKTNGVGIDEYASKSKKLVRTKSILGLAIILPLAASMQYINRWITEKISGVKGAPIYDDFGKNQNESVKEKTKEGLFRQKIISISSMVGLSLLSMMKLPSMRMIEFKGWFPTMDQARLISTTTFASRMAAADDKNELAESTARDLATFAGLYFLGDYAGKATATIIEKKMDVQLLNDTRPIPKDSNILKKFWHWVKDVNIKSSEEVVSKTAEALAGRKPTAEEKKIIEKELKRAVNLRSACQVANLGVSLILLGLIIPIWTRNSTKKKHAEDLKRAEELSLNKNSDADKKSYLQVA